MLRFLILTIPVAALAQPVPLPKPNYCFAFLNAVPDRPEIPKGEAERIQAAHLAHLGSLAEKRWLLAAGPIGTPGPNRGILISACQSVEEANQLASADPAVKANRLTVETFQWSGPAGIAQQYWKRREADPTAKDKMMKHSVVLLERTPETRWASKAAFEKHMTIVRSLLESGKLAAAGPFHGSERYFGIFVFRDTLLDEARQTIEADPMVAESNVRLKLLEWWVSDGVLPR